MRVICKVMRLRAEYVLCDTSPTSAPSKNSSLGFFWIGWNPTPTDCPLGWVSVFFLFVPPHPWPATVSSKNNPDTYPFPATYPPPATYPNSKPKPKSPPWFQSFSATVEASSHSSKLYRTPKVLSHSITSATFLQSFAIAIAITRGEKVKKK
jgi:hypothetical protein